MAKIDKLTEKKIEIQPNIIVEEKFKKAQSAFLDYAARKGLSFLNGEGGISLKEKALKEEYGEDLQTEIVVVNPTAGSHCGPDTVGICFHAIHR